MSSTKDSESRSRNGKRSSVTESSATSVTTIYDPRVPTILEDAGVLQLADSDLAQNYEELKEKLEKSRASMSPTLSDYERFRARYQKAQNENQVQHEVIAPYLIRPDYHSYGYNMSFSELAPVTLPTQERIPAPKPDYYTGANSKDLNPQIRRECWDRVVPSKKPGPIVPNQSLEAKGPDGTTRTAETQAIHNGAVGARAIESLRAYGQQDTPELDRRARSHSATFVGGTISLYATHTGPAQNGSLGNTYHTNLVASEAAIGGLGQFRRGVRMYRNQLDIAAEDRNQAIRQAHARLAAIQKESVATGDSGPPRKRRTKESCRHDSTPNERDQGDNAEAADDENSD